MIVWKNVGYIFLDIMGINFQLSTQLHPSIDRCISVYMYSCIYVYICAFSWINLYIYTCVFLNNYAWTLMPIHKYTQTNTHKYLCIHIYTCIHEHMNVYIPMYTDTHIYMSCLRLYTFVHACIWQMHWRCSLVCWHMAWSFSNKKKCDLAVADDGTSNTRKDLTW